MADRVKVRIAVAVDPEGMWNACGGSWSLGDDKLAMDICIDQLAEGEARYWVETEVELPSSAAPITVEATPAGSNERDGAS